MFSESFDRLLIVFDEPTTSLHPSEIEPLWKRIEGLRDAGNTVVLIEHNRRSWNRADWLIELGPRAGEFGGEVIWEGPGKDAPFGQSEPETSERSAQTVRTDRLMKLQHLRTQECWGRELRGSARVRRWRFRCLGKWKVDVGCRYAR